ncbi:MAG: hypothetical protein E6G82_07550 [Alphaproteobacteria bacterium]|nr:MAG: hypothetical protein E6G82_07550 [Alphaproteobacteria bacterium]
MSKPLPLPVWDRKAGELIQDFMDDSPSTYESRPRPSLTQWLQSYPMYDWLLAAYQNTTLSARKIEPFIRKHGIDISEFEPVSVSRMLSFLNVVLGRARAAFRDRRMKWLKVAEALPNAAALWAHRVSSADFRFCGSTRLVVLRFQLESLASPGEHRHPRC